MISYVIIQSFSDTSTQSIGNAPTITFEQEHLQISVTQGNEILLSGVHATDVEDGDLTANVQIESKSAFITGTKRSITYVVFDSNNNVSRATRTIEYIDYVKPTFSLNDQLSGEKYSTDILMNNLHANSCIDGDISSKITIKNTSFVEENKLELMLNVTDSTNTTSYLTVNYYLEAEADINIMLNNYLVYINQGEVYDYRGNIKNIVEKKTKDMTLVSDINIEVPDMSEPGIYEVNYTIERENGNIGKTRMIVVVRG